MPGASGRRFPGSNMYSPAGKPCALTVTENPEGWEVSVGFVPAAGEVADPCEGVVVDALLSVEDVGEDDANTGLDDGVVDDGKGDAEVDGLTAWE